MQFIGGYGSDEDEDDSNDQMDVDIAPSVSLTSDPHSFQAPDFTVQPITYNPRATELYRPSFGPGARSGETGPEGRKFGAVDFHMNDVAFAERTRAERAVRRRKRKRKDVEVSLNGTTGFVEITDPSGMTLSGFPAEAFVDEEDEEVEEEEGETSGKPPTQIEEAEADDDDGEPPAKRRKVVPYTDANESFTPDESPMSSYLFAPSFVAVLSNQKCRLASTTKGPFLHLTGHERGINRIKFFPKYGHILLSASLDGTVRLWDVTQQRRRTQGSSMHPNCVAVYHGLSRSVVDFDFCGSGTAESGGRNQFLCCTATGGTLLWDIEKGTVVRSLEFERVGDDDRGGVGTVVKSNPRNGVEVLIGYRGNQVRQWDLRSESPLIRVYDKHQRQINDLIFVENDSRFATCSSDRAIRVWDYGNDEDSVKFLYHSFVKVPLRMTLHPSGDFLLVQSIVSKIFVYHVGGSYHIVGRKEFMNHRTTKYAITPGFAHDGKIVFSGDSNGNMWFWRWDDPSRVEKWKGCHGNVIIDSQWHPFERSTIATSSWDNTIKIWK